MNRQIEILKLEIGELMQGLLAQHEFDAVAQLSPLLSKAQDIHKRSTELQKDTLELEARIRFFRARPATEVAASPSPCSRTPDIAPQANGRSRRSTLRIRIDWKANGKAHEPEEVFENTAAASMARFLSRLVEVYGQEAIDKLKEIRVNRGPLLSREPNRDFRNQTQGDLYGHRKLHISDYYVLTHSSTSEKTAALNLVSRTMGLIAGSVQIDAVNRQDLYE